MTQCVEICEHPLTSSCDTLYILVHIYIAQNHQQVFIFFFTALSSCQTVFPDFIPTGYIRENVECMNAGNTPCNAIYQNYTKPSCTGCPLIQLDECTGSQLVNCESATDIEYAEAAFQFNTAQPPQPNPCTIVMAETAECIQAAVRKVRELRNTSEHGNLQLSIRGGRHSYIGASTVSKGVIIDVSQFKAFVPSTVADTVIMGVGNTLIEVYANLWNLTQSSLPRSLFPGGTCPTVGLSGLILGGGQGIVGRNHGLACDNILEYQMVNATGDVLVVNNITNPDLFWALRGGGNGNFGIVYQVTLRRFEIPEQNADIIVYYYTPGDWLEVFQTWQEYILSQYFIDREYIWAQLTITPTRLHVAAHASGSAAVVNEFLEHFQNTFINNLTNTSPSGYRSNSNYTVCNYTPANYSGALAFWAGCTMENNCGTNEDFERCLQLPTQCCGHPFNMNSGYQPRSKPLSTEGMQTMIDNILNVVNVAGCMNASVQMDSLGGRINAVNSDATAFPHRDNIFGYQYITYFVEPCNQTAMIQWLDRFYANMTQFMGNGSYRNYANINISTPNEKYFLGNLGRLMNIKSIYDPENFFNYSQSIPPSMQSTGSGAKPLLWQSIPYAFTAIIAIAIGVFLARPSIFGHHSTN